MSVEKIDAKVRELKVRRAEIEKGMTGDRIAAAGFAMARVDEKINALEKLLPAALAGDEISDNAIAVATGKKSTEAEPARSLSDADIEARFGKIVGLFAMARRYIDNTVDPMLADIENLKARPSFKYRGVWDGATQYNEGDFCTNDGSLWACEKSTRSEPGTSGDWKLAVKRGRDAKPAK